MTYYVAGQADVGRGVAHRGQADTTERGWLSWALSRGGRSAAAAALPPACRDTRCGMLDAAAPGKGGADPAWRSCPTADGSVGAVGRFRVCVLLARRGPMYNAQQRVGGGGALEQGPTGG